MESPKYKDAGNYTVYYQVTADGYNTKTGSAVVSISKADPTAPTGLTATYGQTLANVTLPDGWTWADSTQSVGSVVSPAATFKANFAGNDNYKAASNVEVTVTVGKANAVAATVTANSRTYDGTEKPLVTVTGEATGGEMQYALGTATEATQPYTTSIPTATNAGTYYVWYKVVADENYLDFAPDCVPVTISNAASERSATPADALVYSGVELALVKGGSVEGGTLMYAVTTDATQPAMDAYSEAIPTAKEPGTYYVWYYVKGDKNHNDTEPAMLTVVIAPQTVAAEPVATPVAENHLLLAKLTTSGKKALKMSWMAVPGAEGYDIYLAHCGQTLAQVGSVGGSTTSYTVKGLNKYDAYKGYVVAWKTVNGAKVTIGESPLVHAITGGYTNKYTNPKKVTVKKTKVKLAVGKSSKIKASVKKTKNSRKLLNHETKLRYYSSNPAVATVSASGKITAVGAGSCKIYAVAVNGTRAAVKVTVK